MRSRSILMLAVLALATAGCGGRSARKGSEVLDAQGTGVGTPEGPDGSASVEEANIRGSEFGAVDELQPIQFDYDRFALSEPARQTLAKNADYLKKNQDFEVLVEGHCDERGTIEYNLALGQKRAKAVREYYLSLGIPARRVGTLSYGEEKPVCSESTEACWARNRRGETKVRSRTVQSVPSEGKTKTR